MLIGSHSLSNRQQQFFGNSQSRLLAGLKRWNRCSHAAGRTIVAGLDHRKVHIMALSLALTSSGNSVRGDD
jgi:hypothetical protein